MFLINFAEETKIHFMFNKFIAKSRAVYEIIWKNIVEPDRPHDNTEHAHCMLDTYGCKRLLRICNNYCFSTATMVIRTRLNVPL